METKIIKDDISTAADIIKTGGLVAVPTETVYGLAGNGLDEKTVERIYDVKGRPAVKPLSLMVPDSSAMALYCEAVPKAAYTLAESFWPGPLTVVLKSKALVPDIVRAGGETVGLRCPDHPLTLALLKAAKLPLAAPSANPSSLPSPKNAGKVMEYFDGDIEAVIDGGECGIGLESTIIDMSRTPYRILRRGALAEDDIADALVKKLSIIGFTGGSGSGKTSALKELESFGALVLDCDEVYHQLLDNSAELIKELSESFPGTVKDGMLDRKALGKLVFSNEAALSRLNKLTHAHISREIDRRIRDFAMSGGSIVGLDAVELIGSGLADNCRAVIGILADRETRILRIMARDGIDRAAAERRIDAQRPDGYYIANCTHILYNNGTSQEFHDLTLNLLLEVL